MPKLPPIEWTDFAIADLAEDLVEEVKLRRYYRTTDPNHTKLALLVKRLEVNKGFEVGPFPDNRTAESVRNFLYGQAKRNHRKLVSLLKPVAPDRLFLQVVRVADDFKRGKAQS